MCRNKTPFHLFSVKSLCSLQSSTKDNYFQHVPCMNAVSKAELEFHHNPALCAEQRREKNRGGKKPTSTKKELGTGGPPGLTLIPRRLRSALAQPNSENEEAEETGGGGGQAADKQPPSRAAGKAPGAGGHWSQEQAVPRALCPSRLGPLCPLSGGCSRFIPVQVLKEMLSSTELSQALLCCQP